MAYIGKGNMEVFVESWNAVLDALKNVRVKQQNAIGSPASIMINQDKIEISFRR